LYSSINTTANNNDKQDSILKYASVDCNYDCDFIWIIHGIENHHEEFILQLKLNDKLQANVSSYCWLENLKDGSNLIEYLVK
jgi:hypothetical protein